MIQMALDIEKENGIVTKNDYHNICVAFNYGYEDKYWHLIRLNFM